MWDRLVLVGGVRVTGIIKLAAITQVVVSFLDKAAGVAAEVAAGGSTVARPPNVGGGDRVVLSARRRRAGAHHRERLPTAGMRAACRGKGRTIASLQRVE